MSLLTINKNAWIGCCLTMLFILFSIGPVHGANWGYITKNHQITDLFQNFKVLPDHTYYYSGPDARPFAIIGVQNQYTLRTSLWKPVELDSATLRKLVNFMNLDFSTLGQIEGYDIIGSAGEKLGVWYSMQEATTVKMLENNEVMIWTPDTQSPYNRLGRHLRRETGFSSGGSKPWLLKD